MSKLKSRFKKRIYKEPAKPKAGTQFKQELVTSVRQRMNHFPSNNDDDYDDYDDYEDEDEEDEWDGDMSGRSAISLKEAVRLVEEHQLDLSKVFLTASFNEDYLILEVVHVKKLSEEEKEADYQEELAEWKVIEAQRKEYEEQRLKREMEQLQKRLDSLKK